jgi:NAD(P)-dependent dehydrogenase (short-subunit alcohol dehydrogenase family)
LVIARRLTSHHNFVVAINYASNSARAQEALKTLPNGCVAIQADVSSRDSCLNLVKEANEKLGGLDLVIANAGWSRPTPFNDIGFPSEMIYCRCIYRSGLGYCICFQRQAISLASSSLEADFQF